MLVREYVLLQILPQFDWGGREVAFLDAAFFNGMCEYAIGCSRRYNSWSRVWQCWVGPGEMHDSAPECKTHLSRRKAGMRGASIIVQQVLQVVIIPTSLSSGHLDSLFLFLLLGHGAEDVLELSLGDLLSELTTACQHDQSVLDVFGTRCLDKADTT